ncbi:MAG TPA: hypothetical protein VM639_00540 [Dongiaceae bacterium]|nr:hypothetical protein [Dongiaceae bacterium]
MALMGTPQDEPDLGIKFIAIGCIRSLLPGCLCRHAILPLSGLPPQPFEGLIVCIQTVSPEMAASSLIRSSIRGVADLVLTACALAAEGRIPGIGGITSLLAPLLVTPHVMPVQGRHRIGEDGAAMLWSDREKLGFPL